MCSVVGSRIQLIGRRKTTKDLDVSAENAPTCMFVLVEILMDGIR